MNSTMLKPALSHTPMAARESSAVSEDDSQNGGASTPSARSAAFSGPIVGCSRYCHAAAIATLSDTTGRKNTARKNARPSAPASTRSARPSPPSTDKGATTPT